MLDGTFKTLNAEICHQHRITGSFTCEGTLRCPQPKLEYKEDLLYDQTRLLRDFLKCHEKLWNEGCLTLLGRSVPLPVFTHCGKTHFRSCLFSSHLPQLCSSVRSTALFSFFRALQVFWKPCLLLVGQASLSSWISEQFSLTILR